MEQLNQFLQNLISTSGRELHLEPNRKPYIVAAGGVTDLDTQPLQGTQISTMVFPLIPPDVRNDLPNQPTIEFVHPHNLGRFSFTVQKSPSGFNVTVRPVKDDEIVQPAREYVPEPKRVETSAPEFVFESSSVQMSEHVAIATPHEPISEIIFDEPAAPIDIPLSTGGPEVGVVSANDPQFVTTFSDTATYEPPGRRDDFIAPTGFVPPLTEYVPEPEAQPEPTHTA